MSILEGLMLGILQGVTEFLPVSSSGHLAVSKTILGLGDVPLLFDILLHVATLVVVVIVFRQKVMSLLVSLGKVFTKNKSAETKTAHLTIVSILVATFFTGIIGVAIEKLGIQDAPRLVFALFIVTGIILFLPLVIKTAGQREPGIRTGFIVGIAQGLGVFPGISRSGITITASIMAGLSRERAGEYAFLISVPAILGALVLELKDGLELTAQVGPVPLVTGIISAFVSGFISLLLLLKFIKGGKLHYFSFYLIPLGVTGLLFIR
ncbi:MAG: undecaprenyl-diphosphate phosphatase [Spirochaetales bacterium]|nr:undecaprenyl-diphosphate phosphatase [Spirochaetales bacterium]